MDPKNGSVETTQNGRLGNSVNLRKRAGGPKSKTRKGSMKKLGGGSDSSQPGMKKFLMEIETHKFSSNGNSPGNCPDPNKTQ